METFGSTATLFASQPHLGSLADWRSHLGGYKYCLRNVSKGAFLFDYLYLL